MREIGTHISDEIFARVVMFIKNNTVVVVARIFCLGASNVGELLEKQSTLDIFGLAVSKEKMLLRA